MEIETAPDTASQPDTPRLSRERIVAAAFRAWGRTHFSTTSLNLVAKELQVTKPAVYRYFRSKDELLQELRRDYAARLNDELVAPLVVREPEFDPKKGDDPKVLERAARAYVEAVYKFFEKNPYHYAFYLRYLLGRPFESRPEFRETIAQHDELLLRHLASPMIMRYVGSTAAYWTTDHYRRDTATGEPLVGIQFDPETAMLDENERTQTIESIVRRLVSGFLSDEPSSIDTEMVERTAWFTGEEMPQPDRVFSAIEEVVQEYGYLGATVERIAERVGITKSSLYHYFRNRDEMLMQVVYRDQKHFAALSRVRLQQLETAEQQLYALFVMIASYAAQHTAFMTVENWIRENDVTVELPREHVEEVQAIFSFLIEMVVNGQIAADPIEAFSLIGFIRFLIMQELNLMEKPIKRDACLATVRELYTLFSRGLAGTDALNNHSLNTRASTRRVDEKGRER